MLQALAVAQVSSKLVCVLLQLRVVCSGSPSACCPHLLVQVALHLPDNRLSHLLGTSKNSRRM
jgi:hypothetical protein